MAICDSRITFFVTKIEIENITGMSGMRCYMLMSEFRLHCNDSFCPFIVLLSQLTYPSLTFTYECYEVGSVKSGLNDIIFQDNHQNFFHLLLIIGIIAFLINKFSSS